MLWKKLIITMFSFNISKTLVIYFLLSLLKLNFTSEAQPIFLYSDCTNTTFSPNGTFQRNLSFLLTSLSSNSSLDNRIYNLAVGSGPEDIVYGLFLCIGDANKDLCAQCVHTASEDIVQRCAMKKAAIIAYEDCMLRYSSQNFFSKLELKPALQLVNSLSISQQDQFLELLERTTRNVNARIANDRSGRRFATVELPFTRSETIYAVGQCTQDLSVSDCNRCLEAAFTYFLPVCCGVKEGGRVIFPNCTFRYKLYPFYLVAGALSSPKPGCKGKWNVSSGKIISIVAATVAFVLLLIAGFCILSWKRKNKYNTVEEQTAANDITTIESLLFDLGTIAAATNKLSDDNKLGEGGFGQVFKGLLPYGQEIAVKRLSRRSGQGEKEFKNEVAIVAKLQNRNLVRLFGFCLEGEEKLLIYEFVPNRSLDCFLFDSEKGRELDWSTRYKILKGIVKRILYLHEDSRLRIIDRDLKVSNVLLDREMNPKISDFGMARIFRVDENQGNTSRIVGT